MTATRKFSRMRFSIESLENAEFEGFTDGDSWNGWACPYFTNQTAKTILKASEINGYSWRYDAAADAFLVSHIDDPESFEPERFESVNINVDGSNIVVYPVGAYSWIWETC